MPPLTIEAEDGREFVAVGLSPATGELVWVPADTEILLIPLTDDEPSEEAPAS